MKLSKVFARMKNRSVMHSSNIFQNAGWFKGLRWLPVGLSAVLLTAMLSACGGGNGMITLQVSPAGPISMDEGQTQIFVATLGLDTKNQGVTWTLTGTGCAGTGCGTISSTTASQIVYTSPTGLTAALTVSLKAVANGNSGATSTVAITVNQAPQFTTLTLPNGANGVGYSQQVAAEFGVTPYTFAAACLGGGTRCLPPGLSINSNTGTIVGTPTTSGTFVFAVKLTDNAFIPLSVISDQFTVIINPATPLTISSTVLANATVGTPYTTSVQATGGVPPFSWSLPANSLPPGLTFNTSSGQISGTPTTAGVFSFFPTVTDSSIPPQTFTSPAGKPVTITVAGAPTLKAVTPTLPAGAVATGYSATLLATGGVPPYTWAVTSGQLPSGLRLNAQSGTITGIPILVTTSPFTVQVTDSIGSPAASQNLTINVTTGTVNTNTLLSGSYSFFFNGFDTSGSNVTEAGNFSANGSGVISSGQFDSNRVSGVFTASSLTGTYAIGNDGRGTMRLIGVNSKGASLTTNYVLTMQSNGSVQFVESDTTGTPQTHGAGVMKPVTASLAAGSLSGNYAFELIGRDLAASPEVIAGVVHADGIGTFSPGMIDVNDAGTYSPTLALSGNFQVSASNNRGVAIFTYQLPSSAQVQAEYTFYFVSPSDIFLVGIDVTDTVHPRLVGEMILQQSTAVFDSSALDGISVATGSGLNGKNSDVYAGLLTSNGDTVSNLVFDENNGGTVTTGVNSPGTFTADPNTNGRIQFAGVGAETTGQKIAAAYLTGVNQGFTIGSNPEVSFGLLEAQTSVAPFTTASLKGGYTLGSPLTEDTLTVNVLGQVNSPGLGSLLGTIDGVDNNGTVHLDQNLVANYGVGANGRGTMTPNIGLPANVIYYIVSPSSFRAISGDSNPGNAHPQVLSFDH